MATDQNRFSPNIRSVKDVHPPFWCMFVLKPLHRKLDVSRGVLRELGCGMFASAYAGDIAVIVSDIFEIVVDGALREYDPVTEAKINQKSVGLPLSIWRGRSM